MQDDIKKTLRAIMDAAEYKHPVLHLTFIKYILDTFAAHRKELPADADVKLTCVIACHQ